MFILSDFGCSDTYIAQMKAAILSFSGYDTPVIDLTHMVEPGNILQGAYHLRSSLPHLPEGSVTIAVVDPGVGSNRLGLAAFWKGRFIVAPDNGLITMLSGAIKVWKLPPPESDSAPTFHGRDVFAVCAARLAVDPGWTSFLEPLEKPVFLEEPKPVLSGSTLSAFVLHVDHFGNCILGITADDLHQFTPVVLAAASGEIPLVSVSSYHQAPAADSVLFLRGSQGFYEIALNGRSAAEYLDLQPGHCLVLKGKRSNSQ
ncbi:MAG: SAM-dependent chlorinase/fluorinase [Candidatus Sabulitectum sp.]|nr:SAM-dependent chlorinase/fluorinase [Candidatus Sabulitectum sp.]